MYPRHIEAAYESHALHFPIHHMVDDSRWAHLIFVYFIQHLKRACRMLLQVIYETKYINGYTPSVLKSRFCSVYFYSWFACFCIVKLV